MSYGNFKNNHEELKNHLYCVGTIYDSFEALIEVLGHLKLEQSLYLVYLAQKLFANEVFIAADNQEDTENFYYRPIELNTHNHHSNIN